MTKQDVRVRRVYEEPSPDDGKRILVDPHWPRGLAQGSAQIDKQDEDSPGDPACWMKRVCPACGALADTDPPATCPQCHAMSPGE